MIKRILLLLLLLAIAGVGGKVIYDQWQIKMEQQAIQQEIQRQMVPLQQQKRSLMDELQQLQKQYDGKMAETATVQFVFSQLDERLYLEVFPAMLQYGMKGIMALSATEYPGAPGRITVRQFQEMLRDGWSYCLQWDGVSTLWDSFTAVQWMMPDSTIEMPDTVYLSPGIYGINLDTTLNEQGVRMVIHHAEDGLPVDITGVEGSLWHIGSTVWKPDQSRLDLQNNLDNRGNLAFDVSFESSYGTYSTLGFKDTLYAAATYQNEKTLQVTDFAEIKELYAYNNNANGQENYRWLRKEEISASIAEIRKEIEKLDQRIERISLGGMADDETETETESEPEGEKTPLAALENERMNIRMQMEKFDKEHPYQVIGRATMECVFLSPESSVYTEFFPQLQAIQAKAVVAVSSDEMPGEDGNLTWEQMSDLTAHGWESCIFISGETDSEAVIEKVKQVFTANKIQMPQTLYTDKGVYSSRLAELAEQEGFAVIIHHGEDGLPLADYPADRGIWKAGGILWTAQSSPSVLASVVDECKNLVVAVDVRYDAYPFMESGMNTLVEEIRQMVSEGRLLYTGFTEARASQEESKTAREKVNEDRDRQMAELEAALEEVEKRIQEISSVSERPTASNNPISN